MAQLRQSYRAFTERDTEVLVVDPDEAEEVRRYWEREELPFPGLPDPGHTVANLYGQQVKLLKFGRMPASFLIDRTGQIRHSHYAGSMSDLQSVQELLTLIDSIMGGDV
jgi:mycoredoxin-dependent peroxiredoxin